LSSNLYVTWERVALAAISIIATIIIAVVGFVGRDLSKAVSRLDVTMAGFSAASTVRHTTMTKDIDSLEKRVLNLEKRRRQ